MRRRVDDTVSIDEEYLKEMSDSAEGGESGEGEDEEKKEETAAEEGTHPFGESGKAWMTVEIPEDNQQATVTALSFGGEELKPQVVVDVLREHYKIHHGFNKDALKEVIKKAQQEPVARGAFVVAQATAPEPGEDGKVVLKFLPDAGEAASITYRAMRDALAKEELETVLESEILSALVAPEELLAVVEDPTDGEAGKDVFGIATTEPGEKAKLRAGENVEATEDGIISKAFGYVCLIDDEISVLPPIWVSPDFESAHFVHFPQVRALKAPEPEWMVASLHLKGVSSGIEDVVVVTLSEKLPAATEKCSILIAKGVAPTDGVDAHVKYSFDAEKRAGKVLPDGTIDFKERNVAIGVSAEQFLGEVIPATEGAPGLNVKGEEIPANDGEEKTFTAGQNVKAQSEANTTKFSSEIDGAVNISGETIDVLPIFNVSGDVDYESGNIDVPMNVEIAGSVRGGFAVKSGGSVVIGGAIENGADIHAKGDVIAAQGIFGEETKVVALGNVEAKFIQNSTVMAHGNVSVGTYILNAVVRASGNVNVEEGAGTRGGSIIGGDVIASKSIQAKFLGSADTDRTLVGIGPNAEQLEQQSKLQRQIREADGEVPGLLRRLGLTKADVGEIEALLERVPEKRREEIEEPASKLKDLILVRDQAVKEQEELEQQIAVSVAEGVVTSADTVFEDVYVQFGSETSRISSDMKEVEFRFVKDGIRMRPLETSSEGDESAKDKQEKEEDDG